jgi:DNA-binding NtrC family response regulator
MSESQGFLAVSASSCAVLEQARCAADRSEAVLITGETGTGKELIARLVHGNRGPFMPIDCTQLTQELATRELFGNQRGAYTGADCRRPGAFQAANGGVAFFDEVGELPLEIQGKLLRVIQEKCYMPLGDTVQYQCNCRIVAATNRDLKRQVALGQFRADLYYRLDALRIRIPPLRKRPEDTQLLIAHFAAKHKITISRDAGEILLRYPWPGNVRELEYVINRLAIDKRKPIIGLEDLPLTIRGGMSELERTTALSRETLAIVDNRDEGAPRTLPEVERALIVESLVMNRGNRKKAAAQLNLSTATLYRRLRNMKNDDRFSDCLLPLRRLRAAQRDDCRK